MGEKTGIAWTDSTWSPVTGCTKVSEGCLHCYSERNAKRWGHDWSVQLHPERLGIPLHWKKPRRIFVCSVGDLFHEDVPNTFIGKVFLNMALSEQHTFQVLTKRPERMLDWFNGLGERIGESLQFEDGSGPTWPLPNVWLGVSVESAKYLPRLDVLARVPAKVRFVSLEPLLGPLDLKPWLRFGSGINHNPLHTALDWVIVGGESGPNHRPMQVEWVQGIADQCKSAGIPLWVKQGSALRPGQQGDLPDSLWALKELP